MRCGAITINGKYSYSRASLAGMKRRKLISRLPVLVSYFYHHHYFDYLADMDKLAVSHSAGAPAANHDPEEDAPISVPDDGEHSEGGNLKMIVQLVKKCLGVKDIAAMCVYLLS